jgi:hypothetical protein
MDGMNTVEIDVRLELADFLRANYWFLFKRQKLFFIVMALVCVFLPLSFFMGARPDNSVWTYLRVIFPFVIVAFLLGGAYFGARRQMATNKQVSEVTHYTFSEDGIGMTTPSSSSQTGWANVYQVYQTGHAFLLFTSANMVHVVPKRFFRDYQVAAFTELLRAQIPSKLK